MKKSTLISQVDGLEWLEEAVAEKSEGGILEKKFIQIIQPVILKEILEWKIVKYL